MGGHRELCLVGMRGGPWDSLVEGQCLAGCIRVQRSGACLGLVAEGHRGPLGLVVLSCKLLLMTVVVAVLLSSLQLGSHD